MRNSLPIDQFRKDDLNRIRRQFMETKLGLLITESKVVNGETIFNATKKGVPACDFLVTAKSTDPYHAKAKLIDKLTDKLNEEKNKKFTKPVSFERNAPSIEKELQDSKQNIAA